MSRRGGEWLAVAACAIGAIAMIGGAAIDIVMWSEGTVTSSTGTDLASLPVGLLLAFLGVLIAIRRPGNRIGRIFSGLALLAGLGMLVDASAARAVIAAPGSLPGGEASAWVATWLWVPLVAGLLVCVPLVFPDGRLLSLRWRWVWRLVIAQMIVLSVGLAFAPGELDDFPIDNPLGIETSRHVFPWLIGVGFALLLVCVALAAVAVGLRFRRARGIERLQVKWLAMGAVGVAVSFWLSVALNFVVGDGVWVFTLPAAASSVILAAGLAVLRYRLYELDRIIGRTLVYGALTVILGMAYVGLVLAGQALFSSFAGGSNLAIAASTLAVAALFLPARSQVQAFVDRRFYRRRYDAQRTLEAFGARLRHEVELATLQAELRGAVERTMKPEHVSLWLRRPAR